MYEHVRAGLEAQITAAQAGVQQAIGAQTAARQNVERVAQQLAGLQQALAQAQGNLSQANGTLASAQATVNQRQHDRDTAQSAVNAAQTALDDLIDSRPDPTGNGKPNPAYLAWLREQRRRQNALATAQGTLNAANAALTQAQQARDAAQNAVNAAAAAVTNVQNQIAATEANVKTAQQAYDASVANVSAAQHRVTELSAQVTALDARAARLEATPLNRPDLETAADAELADMLARQHQRHDLLLQRAAALADRASTIVAEDVSIDMADVLRRELGVWSDAARFPTLASAVSILQAVVTTSQAQRARPARDRGDDLQAESSQLRNALNALQSALQQATTERDAAAAALTRAAQDLANHQQDHP